ncbi:MAG: extracellular solute-binding protein [Erysipelotrichaceae bacterium]|nr:extracellular solute-binding protein [Erysipelotrichaceae bacterium]
MHMVNKIVTFLLAASMILLFVGCQSEQDEIYSRMMEQSSSGVEPSDGDSQDASGDSGLLEGDGFSGELTIKTMRGFGDSDAMYFLAKEFMQLHPNVTISVESRVSPAEWTTIAGTEEGQMVSESFFSEISMEIASGEADYLLFDVRDRMNIPQLTRSGLLVDFHQFWDNAPEFGPDSYFTDVLEGFEVDGQLTTLPVAFSFYDMYLNREILEELEVDSEQLEIVDANSVLDWYEQARESHEDLNLDFSAGGKDALYYYLERCRYMDLENRTASFDSPEFIEFLTRTNYALNEEPDLDQQLWGFGNNGGVLDANIAYRKTGKYNENIFFWYKEETKAVIENARPGFFALEDSFFPNLITMQQPKEYAAGPYPLTTSDGKLGVRSVEEFCLPTSMKNPELAWEFMKYCISARDMEHLDFMDMGSPAEYTSRIPLNKTTFQNMLMDINKNGLKGISVGYGEFDTIDPVRMTEMMDRILNRPIVNIDLYSVDVDDILQEFYINGLTTAQQCAEKLQDRATIWLNE